jgi:hypothetical protein
LKKVRFYVLTYIRLRGTFFHSCDRNPANNLVSAAETTVSGFAAPWREVAISQDSSAGGAAAASAAIFVHKKGSIMNIIPNEKRSVNIEMDRILASAVVMSWEDLLHPAQRGLIHIEYAPGAFLEYLKVWQLTGKGEWSLVCEYQMLQGPVVATVGGTTFSNGYHSAGLAEMLGVIMQHQGSFAASPPRPGAGLIQVTLPTEQENIAANACMKHAYASLGLMFAQIPAAAMA